MNYRLSNAKALSGTLLLPPSKSISNRVLIVKALCEDNFEITNLAACNDTKVLLQALLFNTPKINVGMAGTAMRFLTALLAMTPGHWQIDGNERMRQRPIFPLVNALRELGAEIDYIGAEGYPPLAIRGKLLKGGKITIDATVSSQFITALMLIAPYCLEGLEITFNGKPTSESYIALTADVMRHFSIQVKKEAERIVIKPQSYIGKNITIEADWSSAGYWFSYLALKQAGEITLKGLRPDSAQGDAEIATHFEQLGVRSRWNGDLLLLSTSNKPSLTHLNIDCSNMPDAVQTLAVVACFKGIHFTFTGIATLAIKETNRVEALQHELRKCGFLLTTDGHQRLSWHGERCTPQQPLVIDTYDDHRMALAFAPIVAIREVVIKDVKVVAKSYPDYWENLHSFCTIEIEK